MVDQNECIVALNIRSGGGQRTNALLQYLDAQRPETVVLTEWRNNASGRLISAWATQRGLHHSSLADAGSANGIFVASKHAFISEKKTPAGTGPGVLKLIRFDAFTMLACYFPQKFAKKAFFERCFEIAAEYTDAPFLLLGDLNTGNQIADRHATGGAYKCASMFDELSTRHALRDLWRSSNGADALQWTWLSNRQNGFRIDHAFGNAAFIQWDKNLHAITITPPEERIRTTAQSS